MNIREFVLPEICLQATNRYIFLIQTTEFDLFTRNVLDSPPPAISWSAADDETTETRWWEIFKRRRRRNNGWGRWRGGRWRRAVHGAECQRSLHWFFHQSFVSSKETIKSNLPAVMVLSVHHNGSITGSITDYMTVSARILSLHWLDEPNCVCEEPQTRTWWIVSENYKVSLDSTKLYGIKRRTYSKFQLLSERSLFPC